MVAALVAEDDVLLLEAAVDADVEVLVPSAVLGNAVSGTVEGPVLANAGSATVEGPGVLVFTALEALRTRTLKIESAVYAGTREIAN